MFGNSSETATPGRLLEIALNSPRRSSGACGFGSSVSIWLGAPYRYKTTTDLALGVLDEWPSVGAPGRSRKSAPLKATSPEQLAPRKRRRLMLDATFEIFSCCLDIMRSRGVGLLSGREVTQHKPATSFGIWMPDVKNGSIFRTLTKGMT